MSIFIRITKALKQTAAILLLVLLFFNWYGYRLLSDYMQSRSDSRLEAKLDQEDYDPSNLFELRIPMNLPYHNDWKEFERYNGSIEINGIHYKYVKRKVEKGEMVLLCLPNNERQLLQSARDQFFKLVNDLQQPGSSKKGEGNNASVFKALFSEYQQEKNNWAFQLPGLLKNPFLYHATGCFPQHTAQTPEQPPEVIG